MSKEYKINIFELLEQADTNNKNYYKNLTLEEKEQFSPFQLTRWFSGIDGYLSEYYLTSTNELLNSDLQIISKHPELFWKLMSAIGIGKKQRHHWVTPVGKNKSNKKLYEFLYLHYSEAKEQEINMIVSKITENELNELLDSYATNEEDKKVILKEFKNVRM